MAHQPPVGDDYSINTFVGKTGQIQGQVVAQGVTQDTAYSGQEIAPQIPFSRCVPGPLSLRTRFQPSATVTGAGGADTPGSSTSPGYSVTKDNKGN